MTPFPAPGTSCCRGSPQPMSVAACKAEAMVLYQVLCRHIGSEDIPAERQEKALPNTCPGIWEGWVCSLLCQRFIES